MQQILKGRTRLNPNLFYQFSEWKSSKKLVQGNLNVACIEILCGLKLRKCGKMMKFRDCRCFPEIATISLLFPQKSILETVEFYILRMIENVADMWQLIINRKCGWKELAVKILSSKRTDFLLHAYISSFWGVNKTRKPNPVSNVNGLNKSHVIKGSI